ncbi:hypothetical protein [Paracoccus sp. ME4]|uniref:hypothetical protein n=1 Tax=Paracoccus sp. ME4 TaxID=3138066 RepID=UPI00398B7979
METFMAKSLELGFCRDDPQGRTYRLVLRDYNGMDVDRTQIFRMTHGQALSLAAADRLIRPGRGCPAFTEQEFAAAAPAMLQILKVPDREPLTLAWEGRIAGVSIGRLSDEKVRMVCAETSPVFEDGQPDWDQRDIEILEDKAVELRRELERLELRIEERRQARAAASDHAPAP